MDTFCCGYCIRNIFYVSDYLCLYTFSNIASFHTVDFNLRRCTYAHGQHELRYIPQELLAQLEREQQAAEQAQPPSGEGSHSQKARGRVGGDIVSSSSLHKPGKEDRQVPSNSAVGGVNKSQVYYKTRLCIRFMQMGYCNRGAACTFAHGYEDLRLMEHNKSDTQADVQSVAPHYRGSHHDPQASGSVLPLSRHGRTGFTGRVAIPPAIVNARAGSSLMGVGEAGQNIHDPTNSNNSNSAAAAIREGNALRETPYADSAEDLATMER